MLEKILKRASWSDIIISAVFVVFGILLVSNPGAITTMLSVILGGIFVALGAFKIIEYISKGKEDSYLLGIGSVAILAGIVIMFATGVILSIFRIIIGNTNTITFFTIDFVFLFFSSLFSIVFISFL